MFYWKTQEANDSCLSVYIEMFRHLYLRLEDLIFIVNENKEDVASEKTGIYRHLKIYLQYAQPYSKLRPVQIA